MDCRARSRLPSDRRQRLRWIVTRRQALTTMQQGHGCKRPEPRSQRREGDVESVFGIADDSECRQHVPDSTPVRGPDPPTAAHRRIEEDVSCVGHRGGSEDADGNQRIDGRIHGYSPWIIRSAGRPGDGKADVNICAPSSWGAARIASSNLADAEVGAALEG